jgi:N-carbamoyl-L-amino-acid hydrolase
MRASDRRIQAFRLLGRLKELAGVGAIEGGGCCRLALTDADKAGRDLVVQWMRDLGLAVSIDVLGNVVGIRAGREDGPPVVMGSHIDTVRTGGAYDGNLGVLAGLEVVQCLNESAIETRHPVAVAFFTNEEGARFAPDMMGSGAQQGALDLQTCLDTVGIDGKSVRDELERIGYAGDAPCELEAHAYLELHIEQGPVLDREKVDIGIVTGVQGISWSEVTLGGVSNHAGTTPMSMRHDPAYAAAEIAVFLRRLAEEIGAPQVCTVGHVELDPNLINVVPRRALLTLDIRNTDERVLQEAEKRAFSFCVEIASSEGLSIDRRTLARFEPVEFSSEITGLVERSAESLGLSRKRLPSGAGHDAQMFAPNCPSGMIFVPSVDGISHNVREHTAPKDIEAGANVLLRSLLELAE